MAKRLKAAERRASILTVAKLLFADKGYHGVSVDEIAHRLGVSPAVLYQHFPSKEALYRSVNDELAGDRHTYIEAILNGPEDFASVLTRISLVFAHNIANDPDFLRMEMQSALEGSGYAEQFIHNRWQAITDYLQYYLRDLQRANPQVSINVKLLTLMYQGTLREMLYQKCILKNEDYVDLVIDELVRQAIEQILKGIDFQGLNKPLSV